MSVSTEVIRELGKHWFLHHDGDMVKRGQGIQLLIRAHNRADPEATVLVCEMMLNGLLRQTEGNSHESALRQLQRLANKGYPQARVLLNRFCEDRYHSYAARIQKPKNNKKLLDFDGKPIKVCRKGLFAPVDVVLEQRNGEHVLSISTNVAFAGLEELEDAECFMEGVRKGLSLWEGEYEVFGGQRVRVEVHVTEDVRTFDNLIVTPMVGEFENVLNRAADLVPSKHRQTQIRSLLRDKRSFAYVGLGRWSVNSRKIIVVQSEDGNFDNEFEIMHVVKHEFGHALGLGDLYYDPELNLQGVDTGTFAELDSYSISNKLYNLVMCDHHGPISNNDIEMVILAFRENRGQLFQKQKWGQKISGALGKGN